MSKKNKQPTQDITVSAPQHEILQSTADINLFQAGIGSGKTHVGAFITYEFVNQFPKVRGFIGANTYNQLSKSTLDRILTVILDVFGLQRDIDYVVNKMPPRHFKKYGAPLERYSNTISFSNGHLIFTGSLDNYASIDGAEFGYAILDETKDTKEEAVTEVILGRLRQKGIYTDGKGNLFHKPGPGRRGFNPLYILTSPAKVDWIIKWFKLDNYFEEIERVIYQSGKYFRKRIGNMFVVISSSYHNERNLPAGYIEKLRESFSHSKDLVNMLIYGSPMSKAGGEFYDQYNRLVHVKDCPHNPELPVYSSFDFNLHPHMTMTIVQVDFQPNMIYLRFIGEICTKAPANNTESLCEAFDAQYGKTGKLEAGWFFVGDYSGKNGNMMTKEYRHHYDLIEKKLATYANNYSNKVIKNPYLVKRRDFSNKLLSGGFKNVTVEIDPSCVNLMSDLQFVKVNATGQKHKHEVTEDGIKFQKYGHSSDTFDYACCSILDFLYENY